MATNTDIQRYVPLKTVCAMFLDQYDKSMGDMDKVWILAFRALADLHQSVAAEPKSIRIPVQPNLTVPLPSDYLSWTKIGIMDNLGQINTLKVNNGLSILRDNNPNRLSYLTADITSAMPLIATFPFFFNFFDNGLYYNLFGVGGGLITYGECKVDERNNVIILNDQFQYSSVLLEYISVPEKDPDYKIPIQLQEAVICFIAWKMKLGTDQEYYGRVIEGRRKLPGKRVILSEINEVIREIGGMYLKA